jgi:general secretion pathway protein A
MYEAYWKLQQRPFSQTAEPLLFYRSRSVQSALLRLQYAIENLNGPCVIPGLTGTGKSALIRYFAAEYPRLRPFVHLVFPALAADELTRMILAELQIEQDTALPVGRDTVFREIRGALRRHALQGRRPLLFFDDAHQLSDEALMQTVLPLLTLAESDANIGLSVILAGQPILLPRIRRFGELSERVTAASPLHGFTAVETADYVQQCLRQAGADRPLFTDQALASLHDVSGGIPRRINRIGDMALLVGFAEQRSVIDEQQIESLASELLPSAA